MTSSRHRWGEPVRFEHKTERACQHCPIVKVTRHENERGRDIYWTEFFSGLDLISRDKTPPCDDRSAARITLATGPR